MPTRSTNESDKRSYLVGQKIIFDRHTFQKIDILRASRCHLLRQRIYPSCRRHRRFRTATTSASRADGGIVGQTPLPHTTRICILASITIPPNELRDPMSDIAADVAQIGRAAEPLDNARQRQVVFDQAFDGFQVSSISV